MRWLKELLRSLRSLFRRHQEEQQLSEELQFHLERQIEQNLAAGMSPDEARLATVRLFGEYNRSRTSVAICAKSATSKTSYKTSATV